MVKYQQSGHNRSSVHMIIPLRGETLHCTTNSPGDPGTHLIDLGRMKATQSF